MSIALFPLSFWLAKKKTKKEFGFNLVLNLVWWELGLVVLLLAVYALTPAVCVAAGSADRRVVERAQGQPAPRANFRRGRGRGRGPRAG